jgi:hypothetical protein
MAALVADMVDEGPQWTHDTATEPELLNDFAALLDLQLNSVADREQ